MPRYKRTERTEALLETRQLLLNAAAKEFAHEGYVGANINRISNSAGFAKGTIYNYFPSKEALMSALIQETAQNHFRFIAAKVREVPDADLRMERFFLAGFDFITTYLPQAQAMVNNLFGPHVAFKDEMFQAYQPLFILVGKEIIDLGQSQGIFRISDPGIMANMVMNIYLGIASQVNQEGKPWFDPQQVADFVLRALRV